MTLSTPSSGHDPALPVVTRHSLLRAGPAAALGLLGLPAAAEGIPVVVVPSPVLALFREWLELEAWYDKGDHTAEEGERVFLDLLAVEERMSAEPALTMRDLAAKVLALSSVPETDGTIYEPALLLECEAIVAGGA